MRSDRKDGQRGGGILVGAKKNLDMKLVPINIPEDSSLECLLVKITIKKKYFYLCAVYIPPNANVDIYVQLFNLFECILDKDVNIIILGDFNLPFYVTEGCEKSKLINKFLNFYNLDQDINVFNKMKRKLDLVLSNMQLTNLEHCGNPILDEDQYHPALSMVLPISLNHIKNHHYINYEYIYDYSIGDFYRLYTLLRELNWAELERADNVDMCTHVFYQKVYECLDLAIPRKKVKIGTRKLKSFPKYFSQKLKKNIKLKTHLHRQIKKGTANFQIRNEYSKIRSTVKYQTAHELRTYHENIERNVKTNPNSFWDFVRSGRSRPGVPAEVCYGECTVRGAQEIADTFALYFSSVFQQSEKPNFDKSSGNFSFSKISVWGAPFGKDK
ncbi:uncharacterized protein LOC126734023 [Anthonomus grandis grandis]|uniref:uncharacterized protein LOC126734023 n=1 Tax=Anthonomus grandis grandis TaxID=2921223 RepID=UPI0021667881|nr:uncharacterized protein LOC126734023 [Anthonomus grandis grandis]